jgi:hypothetical protein
MCRRYRSAVHSKNDGGRFLLLQQHSFVAPGPLIHSPAGRGGLRHTVRAARSMIPNIDALASVADDISKSVPEGLTRGEVNAGLYGLGFLGRWTLPRLRRSGVKLVSCYDANETLKGTCADGLPIYSVSELKRAAPEFMVVTARHAVAPVALLKGARSSIRQQKPKIAICVYHYPTDIPDIANYLAELVPEYQFALRHHSPQLMETVLYCWAD